MKILKFSLPTCRPCITLSEQMKELDLSNFEIQEISLRADKESKELGDRYNIRSVPTLVILDEQGNEVERVRNIAQLKSFLNKGPFVPKEILPLIWFSNTFPFKCNGHGDSSNNGNLS